MKPIHIDSTNPLFMLPHSTKISSIRRNFKDPSFLVTINASFYLPRFESFLLRSNDHKKFEE